MTLYRCDKFQDNKRCLLSHFHVGIVPCRFDPKGLANPKPGLTPKQAMRKAKASLRRPITNNLFFSIPLIPPSVNHYKIPKRAGGFYVSNEAKSFKSAVASLTRGSVKADWYDVAITVYLGKDQRGDADNFNKVVLDSLVDARIISTDARVKKVSAKVMRDWNDPRTEVIIREWAETLGASLP